MNAKRDNNGNLLLVASNLVLHLPMWLIPSTLAPASRLGNKFRTYQCSESIRAAHARHGGSDLCQVVLTSRYSSIVPTPSQRECSDTGELAERQQLFVEVRPVA